MPWNWEELLGYFWTHTHNINKKKPVSVREGGGAETFLEHCLFLIKCHIMYIEWQFLLILREFQSHWWKQHWHCKEIFWWDSGTSWPCLISLKTFLKMPKISYLSSLRINATNSTCFEKLNSKKFQSGWIQFEVVSHKRKGLELQIEQVATWAHGLIWKASDA